MNTNTQHNKKKNTGFTIIETMVAVFVLTMALVALLTLTANSTFNSRYAKNEIIANYLLEEAVDYIRNERDTIAFQNKAGGTWVSFLNKYGWGNGTAPDVCFLPDGCYISVSDVAPIATLCASSPSFGVAKCPVFSFDENGFTNFYNYDPTLPPSNFKRKIFMKLDQTKNSGEELDITVTVEWLNGNLVRSRSLQSSLLNWQL